MFNQGRVNLSQMFQDPATVLGVRGSMIGITVTQRYVSNVGSGSFVFISYEYYNQYYIGVCGRNMLVDIGRTLASEITLSYNSSENRLYYKASGGSYGCYCAIINQDSSRYWF